MGDCSPGLSTTTVTNSTFSGNQAVDATTPSAALGGGVLGDGGTTTLTNVTLNGNSSTGSGGGLAYVSGAAT